MEHTCICWFGKLPFCSLICKGLTQVVGNPLGCKEEANVLELLLVLKERNGVAKAPRKGFGRHALLRRAMGRNGGGSGWSLTPPFLCSWGWGEHEVGE